MSLFHISKSLSLYISISLSAYNIIYCPSVDHISVTHVNMDVYDVMLSWCCSRLFLWPQVWRIPAKQSEGLSHFEIQHHCGVLKATAQHRQICTGNSLWCFQSVTCKFHVHSKTCGETTCLMCYRQRSSGDSCDQWWLS